MYEIFERLLNLKGITPYQVSKETGISQSTLSDWKRGRSTPKQDKLQIIADYFDVTSDYLTGNASGLFCHDCGTYYSPIDEESQTNHIIYHKKWELAVEKYGFCWNNIKSSEMKIISKLIINSPESSVDDIISAYDDSFKAEFSDLLREYNYNFDLDFNSFRSKQIFNLYSNSIISEELYNEMKQRYGVDWESGLNNITQNDKVGSGVKIDVFEYLADDRPIYANSCIIGSEYISYGAALLGDLYGLKINDQSMEPNILKNDIIILREQNNAENGDVIIVRVNKEVLCRQLIEYQDGIRLMPFNPTCEPKYYSNDEIDTLPVSIIGKVIESRRKFSN